MLSGSIFRQENATLLLVLLTRLSAGETPASREQASLLRIVEKFPDAFVVTDSSHRILTANTAFLDLVQVSTEEQARGQSLERWVGRPGGDMEVLFANLRTHGAVRHFSTILRGEYGSAEDVEIAAVAAPDADPPCVGFTFRSEGWRASRDKLGGRELPRTVEQFSDLVGKVPLQNSRAGDDGSHRASLHRSRARLDARQPRVGRRYARPQPSRTLRQASPLRAWRPRRRVQRRRAELIQKPC